MRAPSKPREIVRTGCRCCGVGLTEVNARLATWSQRVPPPFVGLCRPCESAKALERYYRTRRPARRGNGKALADKAGYGTPDPSVFRCEP